VFEKKLIPVTGPVMFHSNIPFLSKPSSVVILFLNININSFYEHLTMMICSPAWLKLMSVSLILHISFFLHVFPATLFIFRISVDVLQIWQCGSQYFLFSNPFGPLPLFELNPIEHYNSKSLLIIASRLSP
jgi:hypothetical protein